MKFGSKIEENTQECVANILDIIKLTRDVYFDLYKVFNRYGILLNTEFTTIDPFSFKSLQETGHSLNFLSVENLQVDKNSITVTIKTDGIDSCVILPKEVVIQYMTRNEVDRYKFIVRYVIGTMMGQKNNRGSSTIQSISDFFINEKMKKQYRLLVDGNESVQCKFKEVASDDKIFKHFQRFCIRAPRLCNGDTLTYESYGFQYKFNIKSLTGEDKYNIWIGRYLLTLTKENVCDELIKYYIEYFKMKRMEEGVSLLDLEVLNILENLLLENTTNNSELTNKNKRKAGRDIIDELKHTDITTELLRDDTLSNFIKAILSEFFIHEIDECDVIRVHTYGRLNDISWKDFKKILLETAIEYKELVVLGLSDIVIETKSAYIYIEYSEDSHEGCKIEVKTWCNESVSNFEDLAETCILRRQLIGLSGLED